MFLYLIALIASSTELGRSKQVGPGGQICLHTCIFMLLLFWACIFRQPRCSNSRVLRIFRQQQEKHHHQRKPWWWATCDPLLPTFICCRLAYNNSWCELFWIRWPVTDSICSSSVSRGWEETPCLTSMPNLHCSPWLQRTGTPRDPWCN